MRDVFEFAADQLVICLGPGGVGKTTISAALAVHAALMNRAVDVMTVDPAPRLLDALGLANDVSAPTKVPLEGLRAGKVAKLRALKLDPKQMFDALVERYAPSPEARDSILANGIYRNLSSALAGVADYMAMEQLLELRHEDGARLIVLDTPPAREALDFLDAPRRMLELLSSRALVLLGASRDAMRGPLNILDLAARAVLAAFDRLTGLHLLSDVQSFVRGFDGMYNGFAARAKEAEALIRDEKSRIILVTAAEPQRVEQAAEFVSALGQMGLHIHGLVVNRVMAPLPSAAQIERSELGPALKRKLMHNLADFAALKEREGKWLAILRDSMPAGIRVFVAPDLGHEPRSLSDLARIAKSIRSLN